jgi:hypothetical protein
MQQSRNVFFDQKLPLSREGLLIPTTTVTSDFRICKIVRYRFELLPARLENATPAESGPQ